MSKIIKFSSEAREQLVKGIDTLADAVVSTLGPNGRNVAIERDGQYPQSTKDGVTVAKHITLKDPTQNLGIDLVREAATQTADKAGDGTTTSTLLAREMVKAGLSHLDQGENAVKIKRGIDKAVTKIVEHLVDNTSEDISDENQLEQIATISANNDIDVGKLIATAVEKVGKDGVIHIEQSKTHETYLETVEGIQFDRGYKSPYFVTNNNNMSCVLQDPYILIADHRFTNVKELLPILESVSNQSKSLLIIAEDIDNEALATLIVNKARGIISVCAVQAPDFGDRRKLILEDIATLTGGTVFDKDKGMKLEKFNWEWFGEARTVTIEKDQTTIVDGKGNEDAIVQRIEQLQNQIEGETTPYIIEQLQDRLGKMVGGVSIIHVGGHTETEMKEKFDRVEDALHATRAACEEGIVPGGGIALLQAREACIESPYDKIGAQIVYEACAKPFEQILKNAGWDDKRIEKIGLNGDIWTGVDVDTGEKIDLRETGIIDPTKVTRAALVNAASVAGTILLTECVVTHDPKEYEDKNAQQQPPMMM
tara:strand:- start:4498 stop:6111 length:1614 start_codon:yes stop_codon:yes gene_type:complete